MKSKTARSVIGILLTLPALFFIVYDMLIPIVWNAILSFQEWDGFNPTQWVGLKNYQKITTDNVASISFSNSLLIALLSALLAIVGGILLALLIFKMKKREGGFYRLVFFMPTMIPLTIVGLLFTFILSPEVGLLNNLLRGIGLDSWTHAWLSDPNTAINAIALTSGWRVTGITMMLVYTALMTVPPTLLEASVLDGAGYWRQITSIILPLIKPTLELAASLTLIITFKTYDLIWIMTKGGPGNMTRTVPLLMLDVGFKYNEFGYSAMVGVLFVLVVACLTFAVKRVLKGEVYEY